MQCKGFPEDNLIYQAGVREVRGQRSLYCWPEKRSLLCWTTQMHILLLVTLVLHFVVYEPYWRMSLSGADMTPNVPPVFSNVVTVVFIPALESSG